MNLAQLKVLIAESAPPCPEPGCNEPFCDWPDADAAEDKVMYVAQDALFAGTCSKGHIAEFYLVELKVNEVSAHTRTERTIGERLSQKECKHPKNSFFKIPEDAEIPTIDGIVTGPADIAFCHMCGRRAKAVKKPSDDTPERGKGRIIW